MPKLCFGDKGEACGDIRLVAFLNQGVNYGMDIGRRGEIREGMGKWDLLL